MPNAVTLERLLASGYLPEVLPPCFDSTTFGSAFAPGTTPPSEFRNAAKAIVPLSSKCVSYSQTLVGHRSRNFSIPNPVHFYRLAQCVIANWSTIYAEARTSPFSLTKPVLRAGRRCIQPEVDFAERPLHRARVRSSGRFVFKADIARFFPSIYTHSIAWAFHGKAAAKAYRSDKSLLGNQLDDCFQSLQDRQTMGIPVGQDISRVIAEVVLARVEKEMNVSKATVGIRSIDDYEVGFLSEGAAAEFRHKLERALAGFELALNGLKTAIFSLPQLLLDRWDAELREFDFGSGFIPTPLEREIHDPLAMTNCYRGLFDDVKKPERLLLFFNKAIDLQQQYPFDAVLRFSLMRLANLRITKDGWPLYQDYLLHCALNQPETLRVVSSNLLKAEFLDGNSVDRRRLKMVVDALVIASSPVGQSSTVTWALWIVLLFEVKLSARATKELSESSDCVIACMAFEMRARGLLAKSFDISQISAIVGTPDAFYSSHWLLAFEAARNGWLGGKATVMKEPCFEYLEQKGVTFYDGTAIADLKRRLVKETSIEEASEMNPLRTDDSDSDDDFDTWWMR